VTRLKVVLALVPILLLAGCIGGLGAETQPSDSTASSPEEVPGVTNGTLANDSALIQANRKAVTTNGATVQINQSSREMNIDARLVIGANLSTYRLSGSGTVSPDEETSIDKWSNETMQFVRTSSGEQTNYRVLEGHDDRLTMLSSMETFLAAGNFEVANETTDDGMVVLTADSASPADTSMANLEQFEGRLVVNESGQIQDFTVTLTQDGDQVSYSYELQQVGVESVQKPDWVNDVPPGATLQTQFSVTVENNSYLVVEHSEGDTVPRGTTVQVTSNGTTDTVRLNSSLSAGDRRYLYFDTSSQDLQVTADRPDSSAVSPVTSPTSVEITTEGGVVLQSGSMGWASESAGASDGGSSHGSSSEERADGTATPS
jgi:hypothetical protein